MLIVSPRLIAIILLNSSVSANSLPELPPGPSLDRIRGTLDIPLLSVWQYTALCICLTLLILWLVVLFYRRLRSKKNTIDHLSPYDSALGILKSIDSEEDSAQIAEKIIYALCQFFESSLKIKAHGRSCLVISQQLDLDKTGSERLIGIWNECDHAKFGQVAIDKDTRIKLINSSVAILNAMHTKEALEEN